jgi:hypothetical protein
MSNASESCRVIRLLDVEVLAGQQRIGADPAVPMVGRRHDDRIDVLLLQKPAVVGVDGVGLAILR